jgi:mannosylglycoprotein endo-beta-mannosidase
LEGDANTSYFHSIANGRRRKKMILSIEDGENVLTEEGEIREHILRFYKDLFGSVPDPEIHLSPDIWEGPRRVSREDNEMLLQPFSEQEIEDTIKELKSNTAPGLDGFSVAFYKCFLDKVKPLIKEMMDNLAEGRLDLSRINYGVIVLLPKILDANSIKQYRPICLINVVFKILTKLMTKRLSCIASKYIAINQTAFIPDRNIHDGVVALHEILHDLKANKK